LAVPGTQQGATNFLVSALQVNYPNAAVLYEPWFSWLLIVIGLFIALIPNVTSQRWLRVYFRLAIAIFFILFLLFWTWFPIAVAGRFQSTSFVFTTFNNGINQGPTLQASDNYCRVISVLFGAWEFGGYDASAHLAEETQDASKNVARGMWLSTVTTTILSIPTLVLVLYCIQDFDALISATYANNWAEFLVQVVGTRGATAILVMNWIDCTCATAATMLSAQRVTFALSRDHILPGSSLFRKLNSSNLMPVNAALLVVFIAAAVSCSVLGSSVAFSAITATTVICQNISYLFVLATRHTLGRSTFEPAQWNLGHLSLPMGYFSILWIAFLSIILLLPQVFPVTLQTLNYSPICLVIVTSVSVIGWLLPFGWGGRHWFKGPRKTLAAALAEGRTDGSEVGSDNGTTSPK
jgi:amino acid transporter